MEMIVLGTIEDSIEFRPNWNEPGLYRKELQYIEKDDELVFSFSHLDKTYLSSTIYEQTVPFVVSYKGKDESGHKIELRFHDQVNEINYYLWDFGEGELLPMSDEFFDGQIHSFEYVFDRPLRLGETVAISLLGCNRGLYDYTLQLLDQNEKTFGPFETPVATIRGNIIDVTDIDNIDKYDHVDTPDDFALGYFAVVQEMKSSFTVGEL